MTRVQPFSHIDEAAMRRAGIPPTAHPGRRTAYVVYGAVGSALPDPKLKPISFDDITRLPDPEWARPQHAEERRQAYVDAEARVAAAMWPQHLPKDTKQTTSKTVRTAAGIETALAELAQSLETLAMQHGAHALRALLASTQTEVSL